MDGRLLKAAHNMLGESAFTLREVLGTESGMPRCENSMFGLDQVLISKSFRS